MLLITCIFKFRDKGLDLSQGPGLGAHCSKGRMVDNPLLQDNHYGYIVNNVDRLVTRKYGF